MSEELATIIEERIAESMPWDHQRFRARLRDIRKAMGRGLPRDEALDTLAARVDGSVALRKRRSENLPTPSYPEELPVAERRADLEAAIRAHQVVVVCGETGSGKTTQLPKMCLSIGRGVDGMIGHTQPRRIAARSVARRIAEELERPLGKGVGYKVRFGDETDEDTFIKVMTDGILLAETQSDRHLDRYDTIIVDEAHERSLNIDFLLGYLKQLLPRRPDLKVIITSATIDPERFSRHFADARGNPAPIVEVSGRTYPVELRYRPLMTEDPDEEDRDQELAILHAMEELDTIDPARSGDVLVFMSGEREIRETAEALRHHQPSHVEILPLYARLPSSEQMRIFRPHPGRRIVLATNIAETSLTVPGIRYVIDPGLARISRYSPRTKVQGLPIEPISQASADQRAGRCGRVEAGVCIRLYSEPDFASRPRFTEPEILRTNLASVILQMKSLRLGPIEEFPFVEPPDRRMIRDGDETLRELGAVDESGALTDIGRELARLPIDPRLGRMLLAGETHDCLEEVLIIASALSVQDPRERPHERQDEADAAHVRYRDERSDFMAYVNLWRFWQEQSEKLSGSRLRKMCKANFLSFMRMREWQEVHRQLRALRPRRRNSRPATYESIHRALLTGLLANIGRKGDSHEYAGRRSTKFHLFPGSALFDKKPKWVVAGEIVRTSRVYARTVAKVEPEWIEEAADHLIHRTYAEPHYTEESSRVMAFEKATLFGLEVIKRRPVHYGPIDPKRSRELFIQHALVEDTYATREPFAEHNRSLLERAGRLAAKGRRMDVIADARIRFDFFNQRLPMDIYTGRRFDHWRRKAERRDPRLLFMEPERVLRPTAEQIDESWYPDETEIAGERLNLDYVFDAEDPRDGITLTVPVEKLPELDEASCERGVPGLLREKARALVRALPKSVRKSVAPEIVESCFEEISRDRTLRERPLTDALARCLQKRCGVRIQPEMWKADSLPDHLKLNYRIIDSRGRELAQGRDLADLRRRLADTLRESFEQLDDEAVRQDGLTDWTFGDLPERTRVRVRGMSLNACPGLVDKGESVSLTLFDTPEAARASTRLGVRRLFLLRCQRELRPLVRRGEAVDRLAAMYAPIGPGEALRDGLAALVAETAFMKGGEVRSREVFEQRLEQGWGRLVPASDRVLSLVGEILKEHAGVLHRLEETGASPNAGPSLADVREQLAALIFPGFLEVASPDRLQHYPRYLRALNTRLRKIREAGAERDRRLMAQVRPFHERCRARQAEPGAADDPALERFSWLVEELRVSLFAQELGTSERVSPQRLERTWEQVVGSAGG